MPNLKCRIARLLMRAYPFPRGQGRIVDRTLLGRLQFDEEILSTRTSDGVLMKVFPNDLIGRHIYLTGQFDRTIAEVLLAHARPHDCFLDIGANIGYVSTVLLARVPGLKVTAVEPQPQCFALLQENLKSGSNGRSFAIQAAISGAPGTAKMTQTPGNTGGCFISESLTAGGDGLEVTLVTAGMVVEQAGWDHVDLIKIDVEGHEIAVLRSLLPILQQRKTRALVFECQRPDDVKAQAGEINQLLKEVGYRIWGIRKKLVSWKLVPVESNEVECIHDFLARPAEDQ